MHLLLSRVSPRQHRRSAANAQRGKGATLAVQVRSFLDGRQAIVTLVNSLTTTATCTISAIYRPAGSENKRVALFSHLTDAAFF